MWPCFMHVTTFICKVNQILQKNYLFEFWNEFQICPDRYLTRISHTPSYPVHNSGKCRSNSKIHDGINNAGNVKKAISTPVGTFLENGETTLLGNYDYTCPYWLFSNQKSLIYDNGSLHFVVKNATFCNFCTFLHPIQCVEWSASLRKFDLNGNLEFYIK